MARKTWVLCMTLLLLQQAAALAGADKTWTISGAKAFSGGKLSGLSVLSTGEMVLGPAMDKLEGLAVDYVWDIEAGPGEALYVATGSPAAVYVVRGDQVKLLHKSGEKHMLSVLPLPDGSVLAAATPDGIVHRIDPAGNAKVLKKLGEAYVWDMALGPAGEIYCATGPEGKLVKLDPAGDAKEIFTAKKGHLMSLAVEKASGAVFCGAAPTGLVYRIEPDGKPSVVYDTGEGEVRSLVLAADGVLYAGTARPGRESAGGGEAQGSNSPPAPPSAPAEGKTIDLIPAKARGTSNVYMIRPGKGGTVLFELRKALVLSMGLGEDGSVMVGTGGKARLWAVNTLGVSRIITDFDAQHVTAIASGAQGSVFVGTSNKGGLWRVTGGHRETGSFTSEVFDARYLSGWGRLRWRGSVPSAGRTAVSLRTGNSREPDDTWCAWSAPVEHASGGQLEVPMGRFAQVKVDLHTDDQAATPALIEIAASYRQMNRRPKVAELSLDGGEQGGKKEDGQSDSGGQPQPTGKRKIAWKAIDPNGDPLVFDLFYRAVDEQQWKELKKDIKGRTQYIWQTTRVPDGRYLLRLVASDRLARGPGEALQGERVTAPTVIDNRRPEVLDLRAVRQEDGAYVITGTAKDSYSDIRALQVSYNAEDWQPVFASDGMFDSTAEEFAFRTQALAKGEHVFVFAASDAAGNTGGEKIVITVQ